MYLPLEKKCAVFILPYRIVCIERKTV